MSACAKGRRLSKTAAVPLFALALSACLVPQSVDPGDTRQHTVPIIDLQNLPLYLLTPVVPVYLPTQADLTHSPPCHCYLHLEIPTIKEDDPTVSLEARWFVDYNLNGSAQAQARASTQILGGDFNQTNTFRGPVTYDFDPVTRGITVEGSHVIEMVIAEQQGFVQDPLPQLFPNRTLASGWDATTFKIVASVRNSTGAQCDQNPELSSPPHLRICPQ